MNNEARIRHIDVISGDVKNWCSYSCFKTSPDWLILEREIIMELQKSPNKWKQFERLFEALTTNSERVLFCLADDTVRRLVDAHVEKCKNVMEKSCVCGKKDAAKAASIRAQGNDQFEKKQYLQAIEQYTTALMFAPEDSEASLLYGNRSAVYYTLEQYENALEDIQHALDLGYGQQKPIAKLLIRKVNCLLRLGRNEEAKQVLESDQPGAPDPESAEWIHLKKLSLIGDRKVAKRDVDLAKFQDPAAVIDALVAKDRFHSQEEYPWLSSKVELRHDQEKGNFLVASQPIDIGEIIAINKPFASVLHGGQKDRQCHHCMVSCFNSAAFLDKKKIPTQYQKTAANPIRIFAPVPCTKCSNVLYCSESCRTESWNAYHRFECDQLAILYRCPDEEHLALRSFYTEGSLEQARKVGEDGDLLKDLSQLNDSPQLIMPEHFNLIFRLSLTACFLVKLAQMSGFVSDSPDDQHFAGSALLHRLCQLRGNYLTITKERSSSSTQYDTIQLTTSLVALFQHDCNPNVLLQRVSNYDVIQSNVIIFTGKRRIAAGDRLTMKLRFTSEEEQIQNNQMQAEKEKMSRSCFIFGGPNPFGNMSNPRRGAEAAKRTEVLEALAVCDFDFDF